MNGYHETRTATADGFLGGTTAYAAPEVLQGKPADARSDMFSYGALLFEMVAGRRAFQSESLSGLIAAILRENPPPLGETAVDVPVALERLVINCLARIPRRAGKALRTPASR